MLPSTREWRRKGRQLAIVLIGAVATSWGIRAAPAAAAGAAGGKAIESGWLFKLFAGGIEMAAKKHGIAMGLALLMITGGVYLLMNPFSSGERAAGLRPAAPASRAAPIVAGAASKDARQEEAAGAVDSNAQQAATFEKPPAIFGRVTDISGKGIVGARVIALPAREWDAMVTRAAADIADPGDGNVATALRAAAREFERRAAELAGAKTDADGAYRLHELAEGEYRVICGHGAHLPRTDGWALVRSVEPFRLDLELAVGGAVAGRVVDDAGRPVQGAAVSARRSSDRLVAPQWKIDRIIAGWAEGGILLERGQTASNEEGAFRLGSLEPLLYDLRVEKEGYAPARLFDVAARGEPVEVVLSRGLSIRGRVLDSRTQPLEGAEALMTILGPERPRPVAVGQTRDEDVPADYDQEGFKTSADTGGRFEFNGLAPCILELRVNRRGFPVRRQEVRLEETSVDLGDLVLDSPRSIAGRVLDSRGARLAGVRVWVEEPVAGGVASRWDLRGSAPPVLAETRTGVDGSFHIDELGEGLYTVQASSREHAPASLSEVAAGLNSVEIRLQDGVTLKGVVLDAVGGFPVSDAEVIPGRGLIPDLEKKTISGSDGKFTIRGTGLPIPNARVVCSRHGRLQEDLPCHSTLSDTRDCTDTMGQFAVPGLVPGEYSVNTYHPGYIPDKDQGQERVAIGDTEPELLRLGMLAAGGLEGKIENLGENWISVKLVLKSIDGESGGDLRCNPEPNGRFHATNILPGAYQVELGKYQSQPKPQIVRMGEPLGEVLIRAGETTTFNTRAQ